MSKKQQDDFEAFDDLKVDLEPENGSAGAGGGDDFQDIRRESGRKRARVEELEDEIPEVVSAEPSEEELTDRISASLSQAADRYLSDYEDEEEEDFRPEEPEEDPEPERPAPRKRKWFRGDSKPEEEDFYEEDSYEEGYDDYDEEEDEETAPLNKGRLIAVGVFGAAVVAVCAIAVFGIIYNQVKTNFYKTHFLPNTTINGIDCSNMSTDEVKAAFEDTCENFTLSLEGVSETAELKGSDADMKVSFAVDFQDLLDQQDHSAFRNTADNPENYTLTTAVTLDENTLKEEVYALDMFQNMTASSSCYITFDEGTKTYELTESVHGTQVDVAAVEQRVVECFKTFQTTLNLEEEGFYGNIVDATDDVKKSVETMNNCVKAVVSLDFTDAGKETLDLATVQKCLQLDVNSVLQFDTTPIAQWVETLAEKYDTYGKSHDFHTTSGSDIQVSGGTYGWKMNQEATVSAVAAALQAGQNYDKAPEYTQTAENHSGSDIGDTYIEVNLNIQKMYYYKNGTMVLSSDIVSGDVADGSATPTGVYAIYSMERDRVLKGENNSYETEVSYWMPFYGGYGLHDASWRSSFGGDLYLTNGSHGCVNLPVDVAADLYGRLSVGTPVVVFGGQTTYTPPSASTSAEDYEDADDSDDNDDSNNNYYNNDDDDDEPTQSTGSNPTEAPTEAPVYDETEAPAEPEVTEPEPEPEPEPETEAEPEPEPVDPPEEDAE